MIHDKVRKIQDFRADFVVERANEKHVEFERQIPKWDDSGSGFVPKCRLRAGILAHNGRVWRC